MEAEKRDPGNEVGIVIPSMLHLRDDNMSQSFSN